MRGTVAKELRKLSVKDGNDGLVFDRKVYKKVKKLYKEYRPDVKLDTAAIKRWERSPLHSAKMTKDGLHLSRFRPVRSIGEFFVDLNDKGKGIAVSLSKVAGRIPRPELLARVEDLKSNKEYYEQATQTRGIV